MWTVELGVGDLAGTRFAVSPVHETITAVQLLDRPGLQPLHAAWVRWAQDQLAARPLRAPLLRQLVLHDRPSWPEFLAPAPRPGGATLADQLAAVEETPPADVRASLSRVFGDDPPPAAARLADRPAEVLEEVAGELREAHDRLIAPHWPRMHALMQVDIAHRARVLAEGGPAALFDRLHPAVTWREGVLRIDQGRHSRRIPPGPGGLVLCPGVFGGPRVVVKGHTSSQTTLRYPARGTGDLWRPGRSGPPGALVRLVGAPRARVLDALLVPATTTLLARELGVTPSAVSQQLVVLHAAGLVTRTRAGRSVHYALTGTGRALLEVVPHPSG
jgi:Family of unknown function (DUF5937)/Helix-turn-helix domain